MLAAGELEAKKIAFYLFHNVKEDPDRCLRSIACSIESSCFPIPDSPPESLTDSPSGSLAQILTHLLKSTPGLGPLLR